jgi:4-amino-4-deoxy-L-arabinose transferase-like glycosyltransferase
MFQHRLAHYAILLTAMALLTLPNLGAHSLWDVDEGINAEAAREMMEAESYISPLFNFELRTAKPALLYWLQMTSYSLFGVNEFAARLPSVLAAMLTVLLAYELARRMFSASTGLLAGLVLASAIEFCLLAHAATPDSTLLLFTMLTFYLFWIGSRDGRQWWYAPVGLAQGLACLTKGPIGLLLPATAITLFLIWNGEWKRLLNRRMLWWFLAFFVAAAPWYILVTVETRGAWIRQFIGRENVNRFMTPMENHRGPFYYHIAALLVFFAPWSIFLGATVWHAIKEARKNDAQDESSQPREASRFLLCWICTYLVFFSLAATKLPNYVAPIYPALAILTARLIREWQLGKLTVTNRSPHAALIAFAGIGVLTMLAFPVVGGTIRLPIKMAVFPDMTKWFWLGTIPLAGAFVAWRYLRGGERGKSIAAFATASVAFVGLLAAFPVVSFSNYHTPRLLVEEARLKQPNRDIRVAALFWFQPSAVFYSQREIEKLDSWQQASDRLEMNAPVYVFVPEPVWNQVLKDDPKAATYRIAARRFDFHKKYDVLVVTNEAGKSAEGHTVWLTGGPGK